MKAPFIHVRFNFTLSYITLSPRGRVSHPILHLGRAKYAPKQLNPFLPSPRLFTVSPRGLEIKTDRAGLSAGRERGLNWESLDVET